MSSMVAAPAEVSPGADAEWQKLQNSTELAEHCQLTKGRVPAGHRESWWELIQPHFHSQKSYFMLCTNEVSACWLLV